MSNLTQEQAVKLRKKMQKEYPNFVEVIDVMQVSELKQAMSKYANYSEETKMALKCDEEINALKEQVKELSAPYKDALKALNAKMAYVHICLKEKDIENDEAPQFS